MKVPGGYSELFPHGADIGVRGVAETKSAAFEQAALAMTSAVTDPGLVRPLTSVQIACDGSDDELLLVEWLNALVYEMATRRMLFSRFSVRIDGNALTGEAWGEPVDVARHHPAAEIKGATFTEIRIAGVEDHWVAQCVVDV